MSTQDKLTELLESENWSQEDQEWLLFYLYATDASELRMLMQEKFQTDSSLDAHNAEAARILSLIHQKINTKENLLGFSFHWKQIAVAASVIILLGCGFFYFGVHKKPAALADAKPIVAIKNDFAPGNNNAQLTLDDGSTIKLDSVANGMFAHQGNIQVLKKGGQVLYVGNSPEEKITYNTMCTARGNQYRLQLADGTDVWLNAASSIRFPTSFSGNQRIVEITGEAYFEVAKNVQQPFIVKEKNSDVSIRVVGTHFNVNAYIDESVMKVTLLEGSLQVNTENRSGLLSPGQQANVKGENIAIENNTDLEEAMAWKNGKFYFGEKADIKSIMRQLARWYDIDVEYQGKITKRFWGSLPRDVNASQVFRMLEETGGVSFKIEGQKVIVMP